MDVLKILEKYYPPGDYAHRIIMGHSQAVARKAVELANKINDSRLHPGFIYEAAMLHDIGIKFTNAPDIGCHGDLPYITHGYLGHDLLLHEGLPVHALICERHTGTGITLNDIDRQKLPIPRRPMVPVTLAEELIAYCDKFFSKSGDLFKEKPLEKVLKSLSKHGEEKAARFMNWHRFFIRIN